MPEFNCGSCGKLLKTPVGSEGKQGRCPHCNAVMQIPGAAPSATPSSTPQPKPPQSPLSQPNPSQRGPHATSGARPNLAKPGSAPAAFPQGGPGGPAPGPVNPFGNLPPQGHPGYGAPMGAGMGMHQGLPHRGGMILTFGIVSLIGGIASLMMCIPCLGCFMIPFPFFAIGFGIPAWVMGQRDLKLINSRQMDPSGVGQTKTGFIMGIVGLCLGCLGILMVAGWIIFNVATNAAAFQ